MNLQPLLSIRSRLKNDAPLADYLTDKYGSTGRFLIGQFKPQNVELDYPFFSLNIQGELKDSNGKRQQAINIYWSIRQSELDPLDRDIYLGVIQLAEIGELIDQSLFDVKYRHDGFKIQREGDTFTDFGISYPLFASGAVYTVYTHI